MGGSLLRLWLLTAGVAAGAAATSLGWSWMVGPLVALSVCGLSLRRRPGVFLLALFAFGLAAGLLAGSARLEGGETLHALAKQVRFCDASGELLEETGGLGTLARLDEVTCGGDRYVQPGVVIVETTAPPGSAFAASGWLVPLSTEPFDVARARAGARAEFAIEALTTRPPTGLHAVAASLRAGLRSAGERITPERAGLIRGLTIGDTQGLSEVTIQGFRRSGLSHLLAVSGSNVAIVLGGMTLLVRRCSFRTRITAALAALFLYVAVVGPDASVLRAAAMGGVGLLALATGRQAEPLHALGVGLATLLLLRPQIVFSVGLHLSLAATAGIILWASPLQSRLPLPWVVRLPLAVTTSAQLAVLPLLVGAFGQASVVAPLTNLLAAAAVAPATVFGLVGALAGAAHPAMGGQVLRLAEPFAAWILWVGERGAAPSWAMIEVAPAWGVALAVPVCLGAAWTLRSYGAPFSLKR